MGQTVGLWQLVASLWEKLSVQAAASTRDGFTSDDDEELVAVTSSLARFLRNLVAGVPVNQEKALSVFFTHTSPRHGLIPGSVRVYRLSGKSCMSLPRTDEARALNV